MNPKHRRRCVAQVHQRLRASEHHGCRTLDTPHTTTRWYRKRVRAAGDGSAPGYRTGVEQRACQDSNLGHSA